MGTKTRAGRVVQSLVAGALCAAGPAIAQTLDDGRRLFREGRTAEAIEVFRQVAEATESTNILEDLKVNSARLVDVILDLEDEFDIEVEDEDADAVNTVGDAVSLIQSKVG